MVTKNSRKRCQQSDRLARDSFKKPSFWLKLFGNISGWYLIQANPLSAQITPDNTVGTEVNTKENITEITGGTRADNNLFHSFSDFSVPTNNTAFFNNATDVSNIVGRVTGANISNIDGLIRANGNANLVLINPNGIVFGANARLDIGGSFLGSSADSVVFEDGTAFSARDTTIDPILTVSVPVGLQLGQNSGAIDISGNGHNLSVADPLFSPIIFGEESGLMVKAGQTLALVGGEINFDGGTITAPGGKVELGSIVEGLVDLDFTDAGLNLSYAKITAFDNIQLRSRSLANVTGTQNIASGAIEVQGKQVTLNNGSLFLAQNISTQTGGNIEVNASESITVSGTNNDGTIRSSITNETLGVGDGGNLNLNTNQLRVEQGGTVVAKTVSTAGALGGNLDIDATESVEVMGASSINPSVTSSIVSASFGTGKSGNNTINTKSLIAQEGGTVAATAFNTGDAGNVSIRANSIELIGTEPNIFAPSAISASTLGEGNAGNLTIDTSTISLLQGGRLDASTAASGNAGNITINAADSIAIDGTVSESINPSLIIASANALDPTLREILMTPDVPTGNSGNIDLTTSELTISTGGQLTVRNDGLGNAGTLNLSAQDINLNTGGGISAAAQNGRGGNLNLQANELNLASSSQISNVNFGVGDGGSTEITTDNLTISDRAFITATTFGEGDGGDVQISANQINITGTGFLEFQEKFQRGSLDGTITPDDLGSGIFVGTAATGTGGDLNINTQSLSLNEGAIIFSPVFTEGTGGDLNITADTLGVNASALQMGTAGVLETSSSGNINLNVQRLGIRDGGTIVNTTLGNASAGDIKIIASESIVIEDTPLNALTLSGIYANTFGSGTGGNIEIDTAQLTMIDSLIGSNTGGVLIDGTIINTGGKGGNINIQATNIKAGGIPDNPVFTTGIGTSSYSNSNAGNLTISTNSLTIEDGADFATATLGAGKGGQLTIDATNYIELIGATTPNNMKRGGLLATSGRREFLDLEATGTSGDITINTPQLTVIDGASIDVQSLGVGDAGKLTIDAQSIVLNNRANISASTLGGIGGDIEITTDTIEINQSQINASVSGTGVGGNIKITAEDSVTINGSGFELLQNTFFAPDALTPEFLASLNFNVVQEGIVAATTGTGQAGTIEITTNNLTVSEGGLLATATTGDGAANSIFLNAAESVKIDASFISASTIFSGEGGNINIDTATLEVVGGSQVTTSTLGAGNSGNLIINATESIDVSGTSPDNTIVSNIVSGALPLPTATGNGGDFTIFTSQLNLSDRGAISVGSVGTGDAGTLRVNADLIALDSQGTISADTQSGGGGNIVLEADNIFWLGGSNTTARAIGTGNGGNITIDAENLIALEASTLQADAIEGMGGNIAIDTQSLFVCQSCQVTASSQLGVDGMVRIETLQPTAQLEALDIPTQPTTPQEVVAVACSSNTQADTSELTITGRGGLPPRPQEPLNSSSLVTFAAPNSSAKSQSRSQTSDEFSLPSPAHSWYKNAQGMVVLSAQAADTITNNSAQANPNCQVN